MACLELSAVSKVFAGPIRAVDSLSLSMGCELLSILGPSGCGKTTLLRLIAGLEVPTSGSVSIDGRCVDGVAARQRGVGMVFQESTLYSHMTVRSNLGFAARLRNLSGAETRQRVNAVAHELGITALLDRKPHQLSGGERQRTALGRAIVGRPRILLLDEPLVSVDMGLRLRLRQLIRDVHHTFRVPTIYVTHDQEEALTVGDRVAVMDQGQILQIATPAELYRNPASPLVASLVGTPPMNLIAGRILAEREQWYFEANQRRVLLETCPLCDARDSARTVILGIRPEDLELQPAASSSSAPCSIPGHIQDIAFTGPTYLVTLETDLAGTLTVRTTRADLLPGQECVAIFRQRDCRVFWGE
jgi:ABC-type sugar transport system ATPase subunit